NDEEKFVGAGLGGCKTPDSPTNPDGVEEGGQGQAKRSPWSGSQKEPRPEGTPDLSGSIVRKISCPPSGREFFLRNPGAALRLPCYLLASLRDAGKPLTRFFETVSLSLPPKVAPL